MSKVFIGVFHVSHVGMCVHATAEETTLFIDGVRYDPDAGRWFIPQVYARQPEMLPQGFQSSAADTEEETAARLKAVKRGRDLIGPKLKGTDWPKSFVTRHNNSLVIPLAVCRLDPRPITGIIRVTREVDGGIQWQDPRSVKSIYVEPWWLARQPWSNYRANQHAKATGQTKEIHPRSTSVW